MHPANQPQAGIVATGRCEYWITDIDLMKQQGNDTELPSDDPILPEVYTATVACIYIVDENAKACSPLSVSTFFKGLLKGQNTAAYMTTSTHPHLASELVGLITRKDIATSRHASQKIKTRFHGCFPPTLSPPYKNGPWSLKKKWHPPSTMTPRSANTGVNTQSRDKPFRANRNAFSSKFIGFSVCPIYHANTCF